MRKAILLPALLAGSLPCHAQMEMFGGAKKKPTKTANTPAPQNAASPEPIAPTRSGGTIGGTLDALVAGLKADPVNPLQIDAGMMQRIADQMPDGNLKSKLLGYAQNLEQDAGLSYRQVYWDLAQTFNLNPGIGTAHADFAAVQKNLNVVFNNSQQLVNAFRQKMGSKEVGAFLNDPYFMNNLTSMTGNADVAMGIGATAELINIFLEARRKELAYRQDYEKMADMSALMIFPELDANLSENQIDAAVMPLPHHQVSSIYRYDFANGASLRVENGVLTFFNPAKNITRPLFYAEQRLGTRYIKKVARNSGTKGSMMFAKHLMASLVKVNEGEGVFYLKTGRNIDDAACKGCLEKAKDYVVDIETGEAKTITHNQIYFPFDFDRMANLEVKRDSIVANIFSPPGGPMNGHEYANSYRLNKAAAVSMKYTRITKDHRINIRGTQFKFDDQSIARTERVVRHPDGMMSLVWGWGRRSGEGGGAALMGGSGPGPAATGSMVHLAGFEDKYEHSDGMHNELTGITTSRTGDLFYATAKGGLGRIAAGKWKVTDPGLPAQLRSSARPAFEAYDFDAAHKYIFEGSAYDRTPVPGFSLTPDEQQVLYIQQDVLYIADAQEGGKVRRYQLSFRPFHHFYGRENGQTTLYLQGFNEFKFPVVKKYDLTRMISRYKPYTAPAATEAPAEAAKEPRARQKTEQKGSAADEIRKLKKLQDEGIISKEEFEKAKKRLLNGN